MKGAVPPEMLTVAKPSFPPLQLTFTLFVILAIGPAIFPIVTEYDSDHKLASVTVTK